MTGVINIHEQELPPAVLWRVTVESDGRTTIDLPKTTVFGVAGALMMAEVLRAVAQGVEKVATETAVALYGKGGNA